MALYAQVYLGAGALEFGCKTLAAACGGPSHCRDLSSCAYKGEGAPPAAPCGVLCVGNHSAGH